MNPTAAVTGTTTTTANPLPPAPPIALLPSTSQTNSSVRIVIPPSNHAIPATNLQFPSLVTPPTAPTVAPVLATTTSSFVMSTVSTVSNPLEPRIDSSPNLPVLVPNVIAEIPSLDDLQPKITTTDTPMNDDANADDEDDAFMMNIDIPNMLDDDENEDENIEGSGVAVDASSSSVPQLDTTKTTAVAQQRHFATIPPSSTVTATAHTHVAAVVTSSAIDKEKIGRWTEQEHLVFLEGLRTHGKQWKVIATMIGTRTVVQVRTHAQKYFQKLDRNNGGVVAISNSGSSTSSSTPTKAPSTSTHTTSPITNASSAKTDIPDAQPSQQLHHTSATNNNTLLSPKSTIIPQQQRQTYTKRKSLPSSLPSRSSNNPNPKKSRTNKMNPRLSMGNRGASSSSSTTNTSVPPSILPSYPSTISKSSSSTGSDENWSTISPDNVIWDRVDFGNSSSSSQNYSDYPFISEDSQSNAATYRPITNEEDIPNQNQSAFDLLGEDPLEWLIETDCTQQYLPESSLPLFPFHTITSEEEDDKLHIHNDMAGNDNGDSTVLLRMTDPNVTVQSLFLPSTTSTDDMTMLEQ